MEGPPLGPGGEDITWPDQVAPRGRKASSTRKIKPQTSNLLRSGIGTTPHSRLHKFRIQFQVHLDQFFTREGRRQGAEHLLIGYQQFLQSGVKIKTLEFLQEILLSMEVALSMFFLFMPISSFGRHRTIVPLRVTLLPIVQKIH